MRRRPSESEWVYLIAGAISLVGAVSLVWGGEGLLESLDLHLEEPGFLWGLLLVPVALAARAHTISDLSHGQLLLSCLLRSAAIISLILALTNPTTVHQVPALTSTVFVVDVSASMSDEALERARAQVEDAWRRRGDREVRLVVTAQRATEVPLPKRSEEPLGPLPRPQGEEGLQTNLQAGIRLAYGLLPEDRVPHLVLITDGLETQGAMLDELSTAQRFGVRIHHLDLSDIPRLPEVMVTDLDLPAGVEARVPFVARATVRATAPAQVHCELSVDGEVLVERDEELSEGDTSLSMEAKVSEGGDHQVEIHCAASDEDRDQEETNNRVAMPLRVPARSRVLVVEGERRFRRNLVVALEEDFDVEVRGAGGVPSSVGDARDFDLILVSDVPRFGPYGSENLGGSHVRALETYVREGGALVMTGGENSFGPGGYGGTPLERRLLPVHLDVETQEDIPSLALMLVIDRSGSMSGPKITLAKEAARATMDVLQPSDMLGVVAFDSAPHSVVRLQRSANRLRITDSLSKLRPGGGTSIFPALDKAYEALEGVEAKVKHIILLTDGVSSHRGRVLDLVNQRSRSKTTVSTVAVGLGSDQGLLMQIAEVGGGRYYFTDRPDNIPKLFLKEASEVTRRSLVEARFRARVVRRHRHLQIFKGLDMGRAPPLLGYVSTRPKRAAEVLMVTHTGEPLLARWRLGLGQVAVWTSDVKNKWGHYWLKWSGFAQLWRQLIRETRRVEKKDPTLDLSLDIAEGTLTVAVDAVDEQDRFMDDLESEVVVEGPTGQEQTVALRQTAPGRYEGSVSVSAYGPYSARGGHQGSGPEAPSYRSFATAVWPYPSELLGGAPDLEPLRALTAATGGVGDPTLSQLFDTGGQRLPLPSSHWPLGVFIALGAVLADVLLRRVRLSAMWRGAQG